MTYHHGSGATGASGAMTLDRLPTAAAAPVVTAAPVVSALIRVGSESDAVAVNPPAGAVYTANVGDDTVSVISG